jgi:hypothetical protein
MEAPIINHDGSILIEEILASKHDNDSKGFAGLKRRNALKGIPCINNPFGVLVG